MMLPVRLWRVDRARTDCCLVERPVIVGASFLVFFTLYCSTEQCLYIFCVMVNGVFFLVATNINVVFMHDYIVARSSHGPSICGRVGGECRHDTTKASKRGQVVLVSVDKVKGGRECVKVGFGRLGA